MAAVIRLTVLTGPHKGERYCFHESSGTTLGRSSTCDICICGTQRDLSISRNHCQLRYSPPDLSVLDLGSANGTFVNGQPCNVLAKGNEGSVAVQDGDILTVGGTSLQVSVMDCAVWNDEEDLRKNCPVQCPR